MRKPKNKTLSFRNFKIKFENKKSPSTYFKNNNTLINDVELKPFAKFIDINLNKLSKSAITILVLLASHNSELSVKSFKPYYEKWLNIMIESNSNKSDYELLIDSNKENDSIKIPIKYIKLLQAKYKTINIDEKINHIKKDVKYDFELFMDDNNHEEAIKLFESIRKKDAMQTKVAAWLAEWSYSKTDYVKALDYIQYSLKAKPNNESFLLIRKSINNELNPEEEQKEINEELINKPFKNETAIVVEDTKQNNNENYNWNILSKEELIVKYKLNIFKNEDVLFIKSIVKNIETNEGYIAYFENNKDKIEFLIKLFTSKYVLQDDTRSGNIKALNRLSYLLIKKGDIKQAAAVNLMAINKKPNNNDAKNIADLLKDPNSSMVTPATKVINNTFDNIEKEVFNIPLTMKEKINTFIRNRDKTKYLETVNTFVKNSQFKHTHGLNIEDNPDAIMRIKEDLALDLWYLDLEIREILTSYMFKAEDRLIVLAALHGYDNRNITSDLYHYIHNINFYKEINEVVFNVDKLHNAAIGFDDILSNSRNQDFSRIILNIFRNSRNFLVHSNEGMFIFEHSVYKREDNPMQTSGWMDKLIDEFENLKIIREITTEEARENHKILHLILILILLTNNDKVAHTILSKIDYKLYKFISSSGFDSSKAFYRAIGLKFNWFKDIVNFIDKN